MSFGIFCRQSGCKNYAAYRFTWPGRDESFICNEHKPKLEATAQILGMHLQIIPLAPDAHMGPEGMKSIEEQGKKEDFDAK